MRVACGLGEGDGEGERELSEGELEGEEQRKSNAKARVRARAMSAALSKSPVERLWSEGSKRKGVSALPVRKQSNGVLWSGSPSLNVSLALRIATSRMRLRSMWRAALRPICSGSSSLINWVQVCIASGVRSVLRAHVRCALLLKKGGHSVFGSG